MHHYPINSNEILLNQSISLVHSFPSPTTTTPDQVEVLITLHRNYFVPTYLSHMSYNNLTSIHFLEAASSISEQMASTTILEHTGVSTRYEGYHK